MNILQMLGESILYMGGAAIAIYILLCIIAAILDGWEQVGWQREVDISQPRIYAGMQAQREAWDAYFREKGMYMMGHVVMGDNNFDRPEILEGE